MRQIERTIMADFRCWTAAEWTTDLFVTLSHPTELSEKSAASTCSYDAWAIYEAIAECVQRVRKRSVFGQTQLFAHIFQHDNVKCKDTSRYHSCLSQCITTTFARPPLKAGAFFWQHFSFGFYSCTVITLLANRGVFWCHGGSLSYSWYEKLSQIKDKELLLP